MAGGASMGSWPDVAKLVYAAVSKTAPLTVTGSSPVVRTTCRQHPEEITVASRKTDMQRKLIEEKRDRLLAEIEAIRNQIAGLEMALGLMGGDEDGATTVRGGLRQTLTDLLREAGTTGLNAATAVDVAKRRGMHLDRQSVGSTLSRMKKDGLLEYDGDRYRLVHFRHSTGPALSVVNSEIVL
jgi:hypothetical protein